MKLIKYLTLILVAALSFLPLRAGNDMIVTTDFETQIQQVMAAVADGSLDESVIDEACLRVLRAKEARFDMPWETEENS